MALSAPELATYLAALREGCPPDYRWGGPTRVADIRAAQAAATSTTWPGKSGAGTVKW